MAEILGLGCSHGPIILTPPEVWAKGRERLFNRVPDYQPPPQLLEELGGEYEQERASFSNSRIE